MAVEQGARRPDDTVDADDTDDGASGPVDPATEGAGGGARRLKFPTALTVLAIVLLVVWLASFFVPGGRYEIDPETGGPVPGTYQELPDCGQAEEGAPCEDNSLDAQFGLLWRAPPNGLYGIENVDNGRVGADELGFLYGSAQIFFFVLAVGAFITITMKTESIQTGIGRLALRFRSTPALLVVVLMSVFALGGTTYGMWEETLGFFVLLVPLTLALGYDRLVAVAIIFLGAGTGVVASTVNPFATGVASDAAGIDISDGLGLRILMLVLLVPLAIGYVLRYGKRVQADPSRSFLPLEAAPAGEVEEVPPLTRRQKVTLVIFFGAFATLIYGFVPWDDVWNTIFDADFPLPTFGNFYFTEASVLFLVAAVVIGAINKLGEEGTVSTIVSGASDFLGAALVIVLARGITVVMKNTYMTDTVLHWMEEAVQDSSDAGFGVLAFAVNIPIAFLVPSSSGHAALVMPILAPLADFAEVPRSIAVTAYQSASGFVNYITPTSAVVMGGLTLAKVGYDRYLRFVAPFMAIMFVVLCLFVGIGSVV